MAQVGSSFDREIGSGSVRAKPNVREPAPAGPLIGPNSWILGALCPRGGPLGGVRMPAGGNNENARGRKRIQKKEKKAKQARDGTLVWRNEYVARLPAAQLQLRSGWMISRLQGLQRNRSGFAFKFRACAFPDHPHRLYPQNSPALLGVWYKLDNFGAGKRPGSTVCRAQKD